MKSRKLNVTEGNLRGSTDTDYFYFFCPGLHKKTARHRERIVVTNKEILKRESLYKRFIQT